nr:hypothetical protein [Legionella jordanis]
MREKKETNTAELDSPFFGKPYVFANLVFKTAAISFSVSAFTQPFQYMLTRMQLPGASRADSAFKQGLFRSMYRGFGSYAIAGQKRGAVAVTAKQQNRESAEEQLEHEVHPHKRVLGTFLFSQADLLVSNGLVSKAKLESAKIVTKGNFNWSVANLWHLTTTNWGSRSIAGFINFAAIGMMGDSIASLFKFNRDIYNQVAAGATSGVIATFLTTIPNAYADKKLLASKMNEGRVVTVSPFSMFSQAKAHMREMGAKEAMKTFFKVTFLKEALIRSPQTALTFSIIFGLDHAMGTEPLKRVWPKPEEDRDSSPSAGPAR